MHFPRATFRVGIATALAVLGAGRARGQDAAPAFEVASIKPSPQVRMWSGFQPQPGGRFEAHATVKAMVAWAYDIREFYVTGGPAWASSDEFTVVAKAETAATPAQMRQMLRTLLSDRFKVSVRRETKEAALYDLVAAKGESKLQEAKGDPGFIAFKGPGQIECQRIDMRGLAGYLQTLLGQVVLDKTGMTGVYNFKLTWTPDESQAGKPGAGPVGGRAENPAGAAPDPGPSIFTALQEQLGLKLEPGRGPVDTIVIEHVEKPSED